MRIGPLCGEGNTYCIVLVINTYYPLFAALLLCLQIGIHYLLSVCVWGVVPVFCSLAVASWMFHSVLLSACMVPIGSAWLRCSECPSTLVESVGHYSELGRYSPSSHLLHPVSPDAIIPVAGGSFPLVVPCGRGLVRSTSGGRPWNFAVRLDATGRKLTSRQSDLVRLWSLHNTDGSAMMLCNLKIAESRLVFF